MNYQEFKAAVIAEAKAQGITEYELYYQAEESTSVSTFRHEINEFTGSMEGGVCFRCIAGGKMGYASCYRSLDKKLSSPPSLHNKHFYNRFPHRKTLENN